MPTFSQFDREKYLQLQAIMDGIFGLEGMSGSSLESHILVNTLTDQLIEALGFPADIEAD